MTSKKNKSLKAVLVNFTIGISSLLLTILGIGLGIEVFYQPTPYYSGWRSDQGDLETNQLGYRGRSIEYEEDDLVIILLGDSQVAATYAPYYAMPERRLEFHLNNELDKTVRVYSIGANGYGQDQQLLALEEYFQTYRADLVLLWVTPWNDLWNNTFPTHTPGRNGAPKPTFWLQNGTTQGPNATLGEEILRGNTDLETFLIRFVFPSKVNDAYWDQYLPKPYEPRTEANRPVNLTWQTLWDGYYAFMRTYDFPSEKHPFQLYLIPRSPRTQYSLNLTHALIQRIQTVVQEQDGRFVLFVVDIPASENTSVPTDFLLNGVYYEVSGSQYRSNLDYLIQGFEFYSIPVSTDPWQADPDDIHLNEQAIDDVMYKLAVYIADSMR